MRARALLTHPLTILAAGLLIMPAAVHAIGMTNVAATKLALFVLVGLGFNVLLGYTGQVSFGHSMFFGLGAYAAALFQIHLAPGSFWLPILVALLFNLVMGLAIGFLILRRRGVYFALLTLAFTAMWFSIIYRWTDFTGGENGLRGVDRPATLGLDPDSDLVFYYLVATLVFAGGVILWRLVNSPMGRVFQAIRENEQRCRFLGYRVTIYKLAAFTVSAIFVSLPGSLFAYLLYFVSADLVSVPFAGEILAMSIIGGSGYFLGPPVGAIFYIVFQDWLSAFTASWQLWFGLLFAAIIFFSPDGILGIGDRVTAPFRRRATAAAMASRETPTLGAVPQFLRTDPGEGPLLQAHDIAKSFGPVQAVRGVDVSVQHGQLKVLIGPNGAGKTTLFNLLSGMYPPDRGSIHFEGVAVQGHPTASFPRMGICRSFQIINLFERLTIAQNMRLAVQATHASRFNPWRHADGIDAVERETEALLAFIGLKGMEDVKVADLSGGGKRLLEIGLALASKPRVLLLDEPLAGLAVAERDRIVQLVHALSQHMAVLMVEHDIDRAFEIGRNITVMHDGQVLAEGTPEEVRAHPEVQRVYLGEGAPAAHIRAPGEVGAPLLRIAEVNTFYGSSHILHDVSLEVRSGEIVGLLGRNGAGKSTVIKTVMGLAKPRSGRIVLDDRDVAGLGAETIARLGVGYVPQGRRLFNNLSVEANIRLGRLQRRQGLGASWSDAEIARFFPKLPELADRKAGVLSGGEKQMVAIARALAGDVRLLMLDEPFEGLAPAVIDELFEAISALREQVPILIVEHDLDRVLALADRVYVLDRGAVMHEGPAEPLLTDLDRRKEVLWV